MAETGVSFIYSIETFDRRFGVRHEPEREFDFLVCHANFPPILCATPLFSLKQRDYLRFRPQQGCFCPLNNPCPKVPNCPHCGQMCLPRCAHDTLAFSCFFAAAFKIPRFFPFRHFLRLLKATFHVAALALCQRFSNAPARRRNVRFSGVWRVRARLRRESRTNRRHGRDGAERAAGYSCISCVGASCSCKIS